MSNEQIAMKKRKAKLSLFVIFTYLAMSGRTASPKGSAHLFLIGILFCATLCRIFHLHGCAVLK